jgi:hypothetical protein
MGLLSFIANLMHSGDFICRWSIRWYPQDFSSLVQSWPQLLGSPPIIAVPI